jgi:hypothetical protein
VNALYAGAAYTSDPSGRNLPRPETGETSMTRKLSTLAAVVDSGEPLDIVDLVDLADLADEIKRLAWAIATAADGIPSQEPGVQGIAHISTILIERIDALEQQLQQSPSAA